MAEKPTTNLYLVQLELPTEIYYVEAESYGAAVELWRNAMKSDWCVDNVDEPKSVRLLYDKSVIRATHPTAVASSTTERKAWFLALSVIVLDPKIRAWLQENDPKALEQCEAALDLPL